MSTPPEDDLPQEQDAVPEQAQANEPAATEVVREEVEPDEGVTEAPATKPAARTRAKAAAAAAEAASADEAAPADETEATDEAEATEEAPVQAPAKAPAKPAAKAGTGKSAAESKAAAERKAAEKKAAEKKAAERKKVAEAARSKIVTADLPKDIFDVTVNVPLIHQVVVGQQAAARQGTHSTKTRGDVRGGGRKPYRQKGTGRARQGSIRAPQFTGGGVVHGPLPRSYEQKTPKKMKAAALRGALSDRARHGLVQVVDGFVDGNAPKTSDAVSVLTVATGAALGTTSVLVVAPRSDQVTWKSLRNVVGVHLIDPGQLNTYDVLVSDRVVFTGAALEAFVARSGTAGNQEGEQR